MKKTILAIAFLMAIIGGLQAQTIVGKTQKAKERDDKENRFHVSFGMKGGGSLSSLNEGDFQGALKKAAEGNTTGAVFKDYTTNLFLNPIAGAYFTFHFNKNFSIIPELLVAVSGQKYDYKIGFATGNDLQEVKSVTTLNYLQIPILLEYAFGKKAFQPYVKAGITPAFLLSARDRKDYTITQNGQTSTSSSESDLVKLKNVNTFDNGATVAIGIHLGKYFDLESRYNFGLESLSNDANSAWSNIKNRSGNLTLGVKF